jgi:hypothetical protein
MDHARMNKASNDRHPLSGKRMMLIFDDNIEEVFLGSMSLVRQVSAKVGWPQRLATKPVATIDQSSTSGRPVCSRTSRWRAGTGAIPTSYVTSAEPTF